jgi:hypothetical protein
MVLFVVDVKGAGSAVQAQVVQRVLILHDAKETVATAYPHSKI